MEEKSKISIIEGAILVALAAFIDLLQFFVSFLSLIPVTPFLGLILNKFIAIIAYIFFAIWFLIRGLGVVRLSVGFFGELIPIPFMSALPFWTGVVLWEVIKDRKVGKLLAVAGGASGMKQKAIPQQTRKIPRGQKHDTSSGTQKKDYRGQRIEALHKLGGKERELALGGIRKQESGELAGRAVYDRGARKEQAEQEETKQKAQKRAERKYRPGYEPEALAKEEKERQKIEAKRDR